MKRRSRSRLSEFAESGVGTQGALASFSSTHDANKARQTAGSVSSPAVPAVIPSRAIVAARTIVAWWDVVTSCTVVTAIWNTPSPWVHVPARTTASPSNLGDRTGIMKRRDRHRLRGRTLNYRFAFSPAPARFFHLGIRACADRDWRLSKMCSCNAFA